MITTCKSAQDHCNLTTHYGSGPLATGDAHDVSMGSCLESDLINYLDFLLGEV